MTSPTKAAELADLMECHAGFARTETGKLLRQAAALLRASEGRVPEGWTVHTDAHNGGEYWLRDSQAKLIARGMSESTALRLRALLTAAPHPPAQQAGPDGVEGWEGLAWELCADENGEESCGELIWEGGPIPEPWGERWLKYEDEAKRLIALVQKHVSPPPHKAEGAEPVADEVIELGQAFEQLRARKIAEAVYALPIGGVGSNMPTPFQAGYQSACEEILHRLDTEVWDHCLVPPGAKATTQEPTP